MRKSAIISSSLYLILPLASAVSLSDFQKLTVQVSPSCALAYGQTISSCTVDDFKNGATCSSTCVSGLNQIASGALSSCGGTIVGSSTLLGRIFTGAIVSSLCPNNDQNVSAAQKQSPTAAPATTAKSSTQASAVTTSSTKSSSAASTSPSTMASSSSSSTAVQSSSSTTSAASSSTTPAVASSVSSGTSSSAATAQTSQSQAQPGNGKAGMTVPQQQIAALSKSGGGSPFDIVGYSAASHPSQRDLIAITLGIALLVVGWLMR